MYPDTAATVRHWTDVLARIRFGTHTVAGKRITGARIKLIAGRCAAYADADGSRIRPGIARLAIDCETDYRTTKAALTVLRRLGLLHLVHPGRRHGHADEYQLTLPTDLLERDDISYWSPARHAREIDAVRAANRGTHTPPVQPTDTRRARTPPQAAGPHNPATTTAHLHPAGPTRAPETAPAGATGANLQGPQAPATHHRPGHHPDRPPDDNARTALTHPRAHPTTNPGRAPATATMARCPHGLPRGRRPDGTPACAICRVAARRPGIGAPAPPTCSAHDHRRRS